MRPFHNKPLSYGTHETNLNVIISFTDASRWYRFDGRTEDNSSYQIRHQSRKAPLHKRRADEWHRGAIERKQDQGHP